MILAVAFGVLIAVGITLCIVSSVADRVRSALGAFLHAGLNLMRVNANSRLNSRRKLPSKPLKINSLWHSCHRNSK